MTLLEKQLAQIRSDPALLARFEGVAETLHRVFEATLIDLSTRPEAERPDGITVAAGVVQWTNELLSGRVDSTEKVPTVPTLPSKRTRRTEPKDHG